MPFRVGGNCNAEVVPELLADEPHKVNSMWEVPSVRPSTISAIGEDVSYALRFRRLEGFLCLGLRHAHGREMHQDINAEILVISPHMLSVLSAVGLPTAHVTLIHAGLA